MITIIDDKGNNRIVCTKGTYEEVYKNLGYHLASEDNKGATKKVAPSVVEEKEVNDEEKISSKYGVSKKKSTSKKEE